MKRTMLVLLFLLVSMVAFAYTPPSVDGRSFNFQYLISAKGFNIGVYDPNSITNKISSMNFSQTDKNVKFGTLIAEYESSKKNVSITVEAGKLYKGGDSSSGEHVDYEIEVRNPSDDKLLATLKSASTTGCKYSGSFSFSHTAATGWERLAIMDFYFTVLSDSAAAADAGEYYGNLTISFEGV